MPGSHHTRIEKLQALFAREVQGGNSGEGSAFLQQNPKKRKTWIVDDNMAL
jgi:hypothetical protein